MQIDSVLYKQDGRNRPGRLSLVETKEVFYASGNVAIVGPTAQINLPGPPAGFARRWEHAHAFSSTFVALDLYTVTRKTPDQTTGTTLIMLIGIAMPGPILPLFGNIICGIPSTAGSGAFYFKGLDPVWITTDVLNVRVDYNAPAGQTIAVQGFYQDIPL